MSMCEEAFHPLQEGLGGGGGRDKRALAHHGLVSYLCPLKTHLGSMQAPPGPGPHQSTLFPDSRRAHVSSLSWHCGLWATKR